MRSGRRAVSHGGAVASARKTTDFEYLGLSSEVLDEKVAGTLTKSYQYSPWAGRFQSPVIT
nr:hypothetical protein OG999_20755 [Streptomyces sp. NBC_00886]